ncbi:unnamed protein product [Rotaria socialis]|uniref:Uncharacterized protein n=1 Tax=Rotaria socialis TaxID=392032 RepID=A0A820PI37_9BILA|nr:unnamed protein product [Rotaria socialis]CAF3462951.1 unnamed protein product [Rotaria socialis]CAF3517755.1 unnamed protein product [Rotaria socialis]CAF3761234.1 unnamed protein product [Rotaria socialis]CAF4371421.1 unnamed protein product [Rotaria socialis]
MNPMEIQQQLIDQRRGRYVRVSDIDRRQLIETYRKGEDFIALAKKLNIKRSTARSILRTYIDEGRISAKQRAGTRLRFITETEAEMIREMKRRHPLITIGQIQMRLQRTSNRVLSKASISRILTNSIRLGKRAKRSVDGETDDQDGMNTSMINGQDELTQLSSDEGAGGGVYIDDEIDDDDDDDEEEEEDDEVIGKNSSIQNLDDFQRFMLRKTSINEDESNGNENISYTTKEQLDENGNPSYPIYPSEDEDGLSEMDENETKSSVDLPLRPPSTHNTNQENPPISNETVSWTPIKSEPVCVFVNRNFDSSDSEHVTNIDDETNKIILNTQSTANRRVKTCPICDEKNFSRLSHHLTVAHNLNREESLTLLAYADRNNNNHNHTNARHSSMATVSGSSPINSVANHIDKSPQQTPITINTNNQQITSSGPSPPVTDSDNNNNNNHLTTATGSSPYEQQSSNYLPIDGKKRLLCPRCNTWVLNLTDHLIKKHHLVSKQERLPFLRLARNRNSTMNTEKPATSPFFITSNDQQTISAANKKYQSIIKKYRKQDTTAISISSPSSSIANHETSSNNVNQNFLTINNSSKQILPSRNSNITKDVSIQQKFEQRLSVFRQQFAVTITMQNSLMQQMELLQRSFVSIEDEWNDMRKEIVQSVS